MSKSRPLRVATYNVHKCRGIDGRVRPGRIAEVAREIEADILALQEVLCLEGEERENQQARFLAEELGLEPCMGEVRRLRGGAYGNLVLSRFALSGGGNHDLTVPGCEPRGCLGVDVELGSGESLRVYNVHLGTAFFERRHQAPRLVQILKNGAPAGGRIMLGDFNEWTRGLASQLVGAELRNVDRRKEARRSRTFPGVLPLMYLDHIYFDGPLELESFRVHRSRTALVASDHLPLVAEFRLLGSRPSSARDDDGFQRGTQGSTPSGSSPCSPTPWPCGKPDREGGRAVRRVP